LGRSALTSDRRENLSGNNLELIFADCRRSLFQAARAKIGPKMANVQTSGFVLISTYARAELKP
jgi:hypothetical protein